MALPLLEPFTGTAAVLPNPPWTQQETTTVNRDGSGSGKASAADATHDISAFDNSNTYNNNQYAQATIVSGLSAGNNYAAVCVRCSSSGATKNYYYLYTDGTTGTGHARIGKYVAGTDTELLALATAPVNGDVIRLEVSGSLLTAYKNGSSIGSVTDGGASLASGAAGCGFYNNVSNSVLIDTWEGGNLAAFTPRDLAHTMQHQTFIAQ